MAGPVAAVLRGARIKASAYITPSPEASAATLKQWIAYGKLTPQTGLATPWRRHLDAYSLRQSGSDADRDRRVIPREGCAEGYDAKARNDDDLR